MEFVQNQKGFMCLYVNGYKHTKNREGKSGRIFWRCSHRKCRGNVTTMGNRLIHMSNHNHPPNHGRRHSSQMTCNTVVAQIPNQKVNPITPSVPTHIHVPDTSTLHDPNFLLRIKQEESEEHNTMNTQIADVQHEMDTTAFRAAEHLSEGGFSVRGASHPTINTHLTVNTHPHNIDTGQLQKGSLGNVKQVVTTLNSGGKLLEMVKTVLPPLTYSQHKGEAGRIAIIGGSQEYTGAPYFAAISALKVGGDLSHVFCCSDSASGIQSYSPDLIVHPLLDRPHAVSQISEWLTRMHSLVIGPGLGRNHTVLQNVKEIILKAQEMDIPIVIDADGLYLVTQEPGVIEKYKKAVLTPNEVEFARLFRKVLNDDPREDEPVSDVSLLASALGNVTLVRKGLNDIICDGDNVLVCCGEGSPRRCGGQGDLLSGSMGTFIYWAHRAAQKEQTDPSLELYGPAICAAFGACSLIKECNRQAFQKHRRSTTTTDMVEHIQAAFEQLYT